MTKYVLVLSCKDSIGIVSRLTKIVADFELNIIHLDQHTTPTAQPMFFCRLELENKSGSFDETKFRSSVQIVMSSLNATWKLYCLDAPMNIGLLVSKSSHCLLEVLHQYESGDLTINIDFVISNHKEHRGLVTHYNIPFYYVDSSNKQVMEAEILNYAKHTDVLVLARFMQILSESFIRSYEPKKIINIHHSFLPSFKGAKAYHQAYEKGVKMIGATAHFVTSQLDEGPIINQMVENVSHKDDVVSLQRKGKYLEKVGLVDAIKLYTQHRVIIWNNRTLVFN
jgi:formyltetrahydrofolate deformylase